MTSFLLAVVAFLAAHSIPSIKPVRAGLVERLGLPAYLVGYSLLSLALLSWVIIAALNAPYVELWGQPRWAWHPAIALAAFGVTLAVYGLLRPNPLSVSLSPASFDVRRPGIVAFLRHPVMAGFLLWGLGHLLINGDLVLIVLFGSLTLFAAFGMRIIDKKIERRLGADHVAALKANIARVRAAKPFWRLFSVWDGLGLAAGALVVALLIGGLHLALFAVNPLAGV